MRDPIQILRNTPVDERRLAAVRQRVLERVAAGSPGPGRWILAGAVASGLLAAWLWPAPVTLEPPAAAWRAPAPPQWAFESVRVVRRGHGLPPVARKLRGEPQREPEMTVVAVEERTAMVRIPTSNPDVVLYWLVDGGGD